MENNLIHRDRLLGDLVDGLKKLGSRDVKLSSVRVRLFVKGEKEPRHEILGLTAALDVLTNDIYWDVNGDWREANRVVVDTY